MEKGILASRSFPWGFLFGRYRRSPVAVRPAVFDGLALRMLTEVPKGGDD